MGMCGLGHIQHPGCSQARSLSFGHCGSHGPFSLCSALLLTPPCPTEKGAAWDSSPGAGVPGLGWKGQHRSSFSGARAARCMQVAVEENVISLFGSFDKESAEPTAALPGMGDIQGESSVFSTLLRPFLGGGP